MVCEHLNFPLISQEFLGVGVASCMAKPQEKLSALKSLPNPTNHQLLICLLLLFLFLFAFFIYFSNLGIVSSFIIFPAYAFPLTKQPTSSDHDLAHKAGAGASHDTAMCDLYNGTWIRDFGGTIYTNLTCQTLPKTNDCEKYGKDHDFVKWKWKPHGCHLPRFDPELFLDALRGMNLAFVGDSVARNHKDSLLCMLSQVESPQNTYNDVENQITKWYFETYNFTLIHLWTKFLVRSEERAVNGSGTETHVYLDQVDPNWANHLHQVHYVVLSGCHWFFRELYLFEHNKLIGTVFDTPKNIPALGVIFSVQSAFRAAINYLKSYSGSDLRLVVVRTVSPKHFEGGAWNTGGSCERTRPNFEEGRLSGINLELRNAVLNEVEAVRKGAHVQFATMDVTWMMEMRPDGHPGTHYDNRWNHEYSDCTHWCMPGAIDTWNQLLYHTIIQSQSDQSTTNLDM